MRHAALLVTIMLALLAGCAVVDAPSIDPGLPVSPNNPRLTWPETEGAAGYQVQLCHRQDFLKNVITLPETEEPALCLKDLIEHNRIYFWRVRAIDSDGFRGPWSQKGYFNVPLRRPVPVSPIGEICTRRPAFIWQKPESARRYVVQISTDNFFRFPEIRYETTARDYFPAMEVPQTDKKYYWRVRAISTDGALSQWSEPVEFVVSMSSPAAGLSPADGGVVASLRPTFTWSGEEGALRYQIEIIRADEVDAPEPPSMRLEFSKGATASLTLKKALAPDTDYAWRVRPIMPDAPGRWSDYVTFRTPNET